MTDTETQSQQGSPFWRFSLQFYDQPAVADACIALQDRAGIDVDLLLFLFWQATRQRALSPAEIAALDASVGAWRDATVVPLRAVRRALKTLPTLVEADAAEAFRNRIKAVELEAERLQQEAMYALAQSPPLGRDHPSPAEAARVNIAAYETMRAVAFPTAARDRLLAAFAAMHPEGKGE